jgi:hypothetical protein
MSLARRLARLEQQLAEELASQPPPPLTDEERVRLIEGALRAAQGEPEGQASHPGL